MKERSIMVARTKEGTQGGKVCQYGERHISQEGVDLEILIIE